MSIENKTVPFYFVPNCSRHPVISVLGLFFVVFGVSQWMNNIIWGKWLFILGLITWLTVLYQWFRDATYESEAGLYSKKIDISYRWSMAWFLFSEVMFFGTFFFALWWIKTSSTYDTATLENNLTWSQQIPDMAKSQENIVKPIYNMTPFWLPTINTFLLMLSGVTLTFAHRLFIKLKRVQTIIWLWCTIILGFIFLCIQGYEYIHAYTHLNLKISSGAYGSIFFMLTGFHGFHVFIGIIILSFINLRLHIGHFSEKLHFGLEGAAWYWHFVDAVWVMLYILIYCI